MVHQQDRDIPFARDKVDQAKVDPVLRKERVPRLRARLDQAVLLQDSLSGQAARVREVPEAESRLEFRRPNQVNRFTLASLPPLAAGR